MEESEKIVRISVTFSHIKHSCLFGMRFDVVFWLGGRRNFRENDITQLLRRFGKFLVDWILGCGRVLLLLI